jgi:hypothetical protein
MRSFKTALTVIGAVTVLVLAGNTVALAATGHSFILGKVNKANKVTTLKRTTSGAALNLVTKPAGTAPLTVNSNGKVNNLNADSLDGLDSSSFASGGYSTSFSSNVVMTSAGEPHQLMSLAVPAGKYVVVSRLQGQTGNDGGGNNFRYDCTLAGAAGTIEAPIYRVGMTNDIENYLTYQGVYSGAGPITLTCRSANAHTLTALSGSIVAMKVGS